MIYWSATQSELDAAADHLKKVSVEHDDLDVRLDAARLQERLVFAPSVIVPSWAGRGEDPAQHAYFRLEDDEVDLLGGLGGSILIRTHSGN